MSRAVPSTREFLRHAGNRRCSLRPSRTFGPKRSADPRFHRGFDDHAPHRAPHITFSVCPRLNRGVAGTWQDYQPCSSVAVLRRV
jgi:hypothetical protein